MAFVVWLARRPARRRFEPIFYIILVTFPLLILSHEMMAIWLPYLLIVYLFTVPLTPKRTLILAGLLMLSILAFVTSMLATVDEAMVDEINRSIRVYGYSNTGGAVSFLKDDAYDAFTFTWYTAKANGYLIYYPKIVFLCMLALIPVRKNLSLVIVTPWVKPLLVVTAIGTVMIFSVAVDWGRFIYASFMPLFLLTLLVDNQKKLTSYSLNKAGAVTLICIIYAGGWHIRHAI